MRGALAFALLACAPAFAQQAPAPFWVAPAKQDPPKEATTEPPQAPAKPVRTAKKKKKAPAKPAAPEAGPVQPPAASRGGREPLPPIPVEQLHPVPLSPEPAPPPATGAPAPAQQPPELVAPVRPPVLVEPAEAPQKAAETPWRRVTISGVGGLWAKTHSDAGSRTWNPAYGIIVGWDFWPGLFEAELQAVRTGGTSGSPFANAAVTHNLFALRVFLVLGGPRVSLLVGGGGGLELVQTRYYILDPANLDASGRPKAQTLEATAGGAAFQPAAVLRASIVRGLTLRAEVTAVARDGRLAPMPLFGLGWAF